MTKSWRFYDIAIWASWILIAALNYFPAKVEEGDHKVREFIINYKFYIGITLIIIFILAKIWKSRKESTSGKTNLQYYVELLHKKYFPHSTGGKDPDSRVTVFVPCRPFPFFKKWLKFYVRSGLPVRSNARWDIAKSENKNYDGVAGKAWAQEIFLTIDNLPDYNNANKRQKKEYCKKTMITEEKIESVKVKSRSFRCLVIKNKMGKKVGALMMESTNEIGLANIDSGTFTDVAGTLQCFFH